MPRIAAILIYPVEGCRGLRVKSCGLAARGRSAAVAATPPTLRAQFGITLAPELGATASVQLRPGQSLDVELRGAP